VFKQSKLAAAVLAAVATTSVQAVNLGDDGTGEVLIFPYYNVNNGFVTQISVTNTTEYFKAVKPKKLEGRLLNINFKETKDGNTRVVAIFAKRARGMMADYILRNRIEKPEDIKKFKQGGYRFSRQLSDARQWTFERPQPPAA